jgi:hypothetical protein
LRSKNNRSVKEIKRRQGIVSALLFAPFLFMFWPFQEFLFHCEWHIIFSVEEREVEPNNNNNNNNTKGNFMKRSAGPT